MLPNAGKDLEKGDGSKCWPSRSKHSFSIVSFMVPTTVFSREKL